MEPLLGYAGVIPSRLDHPLGSHSEIGWRLVQRCWDHGYATEAARAALDDAFTRLGLAKVIAYTSLDNLARTKCPWGLASPAESVNRSRSPANKG
jgi:RimJ/RimL family protein N-acetyltransferase